MSLSNVHSTVYESEECVASDMICVCVCVYRISLDEGRHWDKLSFSSTPLFVDGVLMTPETENRIIT